MRISEPPRVARNQRLTFLVQQHDAEHLVVDQAAQKLADARQQRIELENRCQFRRNLVEYCQRLCLARYARVEARIFDCLRDARSGQGEQMQMLRPESSRPVRFPDP